MNATMYSNFLRNSNNIIIENELEFLHLSIKYRCVCKYNLTKFTNNNEILTSVKCDKTLSIKIP